MTDLIVALDLPVSKAIDISSALIDQTPVRLFKIGHQLLLQPGGYALMRRLCVGWGGTGVFLDLKLYDVSDTVETAARRAFDLGARFLTVHATPSMLKAAMCAKEGGAYGKVLAVGRLTDGNGFGFLPGGPQADGHICSVVHAAEIRSWYAGLLVCPGIRPAGAAPDNHALAATPAQARAAGADFIVVGRPIINADDPVAAARAILADLNEDQDREQP